MRVVRVFHDEDVRYGLADESMVTLISDEPFAAWETEGIVALPHAQLLAPAVPTKVVCAGINYRAHAEEMGHKVKRVSEADVVEGVIRSPVSKYVGYNLRICRPYRLSDQDRQATVQFVQARLGHRAGGCRPARGLGYPHHGRR